MATKFIVIGENIHCTRVFKREGKLIEKIDGGIEAIVYSGADGKPRHLPIPKRFQETADWEAGKVKHCAVAIWQGMYGDPLGKKCGVDYLQALARKQAAADASFLDVNVDEFGSDVAEKVKAMKWTCQVVQQATPVPLSIDSSNPEILRAGLQSCEAAKGQPMVNSVSLERVASIAVSAEFKAAVVASAAGEAGLPTTTEERMQNLDRLMPMLKKAGIADESIYVDPLVFPIAVDSNNGPSFIEAVAAVHAKYPKVHIVGGLSNISFGMPARKLINQVFTYLCVEKGGDGGIVDPLQINGKILAATNTQSEAFKLAKALLMGEDAFGVEFITAHRDGKLG
jgi:hypothetical protein